MTRSWTIAVALAAAALAAFAPAHAALTCGASASVLDWDSGAVAWTPGSLSNSYTVGNDTIGVAFTGSTGRLINIFGNQTPFKSTDLSGGLTPVQQNLLFVVNYVNASETLTLTINAGTPGVGVREIEFTLFDLDTDGLVAPYQFQDQVTITGALNGVPVGAPTLTTSVSNTASGSTATGVNAAGNTTGDGNLTIRFASPVDRIAILYRTGPNSVADPAQQGLGLHDISFCPAATDFSDAPSSYGAPSHRIAGGLVLGGAPDADAGALPSIGADGDDLNSVDDEEGVSIGSLMQSVAASVSAIVAGAGGYLQAWFDWNGDGDFLDASEQVATNVQDNGAGDANPAAGTISLSVTPPATAVAGDTYARFRWSATSGLAPAGSAATGEVEDYRVSISQSAPLATCPSGQLLINRNGNATTVITATGVVNASNAIGAPSAAGTSPPDPVSAEIDDTSDVLVLDLGVLVPQNASIILSAARDNGGKGNNARVNVEMSANNVAYTNVGTYGAAPATYVSTAQNVVERNAIPAPAGGARYIRLKTANSDDIFIDGLLYSQICLSSPTLAATKSVSVYNPGGTTPFATPGNDVVYALTVQNSGSGAVDADSLFMVDTLPATVTFFNGDMDGAGPATGAIYFTQSGAGLTFSLATDVRYSSAALAPANYAACTYSPLAGYDANVRHICLNPKGAMAAGSPSPSFTAQFRVRIK